MFSTLWYNKQNDYINVIAHLIMLFIYIHLICNKITYMSQLDSRMTKKQYDLSRL